MCTIKIIVHINLNPAVARRLLRKNAYWKEEIAEWGLTFWVPSFSAHDRVIRPSVMPVKLVLAEAGNGHPGRGNEPWIPTFVGMTREGVMPGSPVFLSWTDN